MQCAFVMPLVCALLATAACTGSDKSSSRVRDSSERPEECSASDREAYKLGEAIIAVRMAKAYVQSNQQRAALIEFEDKLFDQIHANRDTVWQALALKSADDAGSIGLAMKGRVGFDEISPKSPREALNRYGECVASVVDRADLAIMAPAKVVSAAA